MVCRRQERFICKCIITQKGEIRYTNGVNDMNEQETTKEKGLDLSPEEIDRIFAEEAYYYIRQSVEENGMEY